MVTARNERAERIEVRRSRSLIVDAMVEYYATHQNDPTMAEIARLSGVSSAALYRRFPTYPDVIAAVYERTVSYQQAVADKVLEEQTGWASIVALVRGISAMIVEYPAVSRVTRKMIEIHPGLRHGAQWDADLIRITEKAQTEGALRADVGANDITLAAFRMGDHAGIPDPEERARVVARQVQLTLDGLRADRARTPMPGDTIRTDEIQHYYRTPITLAWE